MKLTRTLLVALVALFGVLSCSTVKNVRYFQDSEAGAEFAIAQANSITIGPSDKLSIVVNSKDPELAGIFNLPIYGHMAGSILSI